MKQYVLDHSVFPYDMVVYRDPMEPLGPGILKARYDEVVLAKFPVITGNQELNPENYGGLTPPITWLPVETFKERSPDGIRPSLRMARIVPASTVYANVFYGKRTYALPPERNDPFMIHFGEKTAGSSTGCIVVTGKEDLFNDLFVEMQKQSNCGVPIHVLDLGTELE